VPSAQDRVPSARHQVPDAGGQSRGDEWRIRSPEPETGAATGIGGSGSAARADRFGTANRSSAIHGVIPRERRQTPSARSPGLGATEKSTVRTARRLDVPTSRLQSAQADFANFQRRIHSLLERARRPPRAHRLMQPSSSGRANDSPQQRHKVACADSAARPCAASAAPARPLPVAPIVRHARPATKRPTVDSSVGRRGSCERMVRRGAPSE